MKTLVTRLFVAATLVIGLSAYSAADTVTFSNIVDGNGNSSLFDVSTTMPDGTDGNMLNIGLNNFMADGASIATTSAVDTLTFTIDAPTGFFITSIDYIESGSGSTTDGVASASGSIVADGQPVNFLTQIFTPFSAGSWSIAPPTMAINNKTSINVTITNSLFAFAFSPSGSAQIQKDSAKLTVGLTPIPEPGSAAVLAIGAVSALVIRRRR